MSSSSSENSPGRRGLLYILGFSFGFLFAWIFSKVLQKSGETIHPENSAPHPEDRVHSLAPSIVQPTYSIPQHNHSERRGEDAPLRKKFYEWSVGIGTLGLLVINAFLLIFTQRQADFMFQQLVGTQAAVIDFSSTFNDGSGELAISLSNNGHVTATDIHLVINARKESIKDGTPLGETFHFEPTIQPMIAGRGEGFHRMYPWMLTAQEALQGGRWSPEWPGAYTYKFNTRLTYQDGFGNLRTRNFCDQWFPGFSIKTRTGSVGGGGLHSCQDAASYVAVTRDYEEKAERERQAGEGHN
jgi:hypothetical protein